MKHTAFPLLIFSVFSFSKNFAQLGCPDPQAANYNPAATSNDGSCIYPVTNYSPVFKAELPEILREISGHVKAGGNWYAHNDGSGDVIFYRFNPETGVVNQEIDLQNASNEDWEDVAATTTHIYFGDFGNNLNDRQDLGIYKVPLADIGNGSAEEIEEGAWEFIPFAYEDQTDFTTQPADSTEFDCEALIFFNGKLHLFTKNRKEYTTSHYVVNSTTGQAEKLETFDTDGLITGADISPDGKLVALLGYDLRGIPKTFAWLLWDWQPGGDLLFTGNKRRIELGLAFVVGQVEGIGFDGNRTGYISNERTISNGITFVDESVRWFDFKQFVPESSATTELGMARGFQVSPNPFSQTVHFQFFGNEKPDLIRVTNQVGQSVLSLNQVAETLDVSQLPAGFYAFEAVWKDRVSVFRGVKQ